MCCYRVTLEAKHERQLYQVHKAFFTYMLLRRIFCFFATVIIISNVQLCISLNNNRIVVNFKLTKIQPHYRCVV